MSSLLKNILTVVMLVALAGAGYYYFALRSSSSLNAGSSNEGDILTAEFVKRLKDLERIDLSGQIFDDPRFDTLQDFSSVPEDVPSGRSNPFVR